MTINEAEEILEEKLNYMMHNYGGYEEKLQMALLVAITSMQKLQGQIHCRDCAHWGMEGIPGQSDYFKVCEYGRYMVGNNGFCCYGERK